MMPYEEVIMKIVMFTRDMNTVKEINFNLGQKFNRSISQNVSFRGEMFSGSMSVRKM